MTSPAVIVRFRIGLRLRVKLGGTPLGVSNVENKEAWVESAEYEMRTCNGLVPAALEACRW